MNLKYHVVIKEMVKGPFSIDELRFRRELGQVRAESQCCAEGSEDWIRADQIEGFFEPQARRRFEFKTGAEERMKKHSNPALGIGLIIFLSIVGIGLVGFGAAALGSVGVAFLGLGGIGIYCIPTIIAAKRQHHNSIAIALLNFLLGWTLIGWVAALIWAVYQDAASRNSSR